MTAVLIVDDEKYVIDDLLKIIDWPAIGVDRVYTATGAQSAMSQFSSHRIDVLLSDIEMPGGDGFALLRWVRENAPRTECILLTCHADFHYAHEAIRMNCADYLLKPAMPDELSEIVRKALIRVEEKDNVEALKRQGNRWREQQPDMRRMSPPAPEENVPCIVDTVQNFIHANIAAELSREKIASVVFISPDYLDRIFKKNVSMTVMRYLERERILLAKRLLSTTRMPVGRIAGVCGYNSVSNFSSVFRRIVGVSPAAWRNNTDSYGKGE